MTGKQIGRYTVLSKIGQGGMGEVYLAHDKSLERKVALKLLPQSLRDEAWARDRFLREARAAASIDHPYICKIYDVGESEGVAFFAMEYVEGHTLDDRLRTGALPLREASQVAGELLEALTAAHQRGLVHRDLKPSNIMLLASGHVKVLDFGLARRLSTDSDLTVASDTITAQGVILGTPAYMSPEQTQGQTADVRSDLFSLGVILYEMFTGRHPFRRASTVETMYAIMHEHPPRVSRYIRDIAEELDEFVDRMLAKAPAHRYQSAREAMDVWHGAGVNQTVTSISVRSMDRVPELPSIAVLPFINMSADPEQEYFSDGITEDIIAELSRIQGFKVIARTSVMRFKGASKDAFEIGRELMVANVLEGSVRRAGKRVRINAALVDAGTREHRWAETFDRDLDDVFALQSEVAKRIAAALSMTLSPTPRSGVKVAPRNMEVYHLYLKGRHFLHKLTPDSVATAIEKFRESIDLDPTFARSYAGLATSYASCGHFDFMPPREAFPKAMVAARNAIQLDANIAEAHSARGLCQIFYEWDWSGAEASFRKAIQLDANSVEAYTYSSWMWTMRRQWEEAVTDARRAYELDPLSGMAATNLGWTLIFASRFQEGIALLEKTLDFDPSYLPAKSILGLGRFLVGDRDQAIKDIEQWSWRRTSVAITHLMDNNPEAARVELDRLLDPKNKLTWRPSEIAWIYLSLGEREEAARWFSRARDERDYMLALATCPDWAISRNDPMVTDYLVHMGLTS